MPVQQLSNGVHQTHQALSEERGYGVMPVLKKWPSFQKKQIVQASELHELAQNFDGIVHNLKEINAPNLRCGYRHLFTPEIHCKTPTKLSVKGFHHDPLGKIEQSGALTIQKVIPENAHGCYKIRWGYRGEFKSSTMFPQHWTREQVMQSIQEAVNTGSFKKIKLGNKTFEGICKEGFNIEFHINDSGHVISAYPLL